MDVQTFQITVFRLTKYFQANAKMIKPPETQTTKKHLEHVRGRTVFWLSFDSIFCVSCTI